MKTKGLKRFIGDRAFYKMLFVLILPMVVQQGITNLVTLLDNVMVGSLGTLQMSGVSIVNQLIFVFNLSLFGALGGILLTDFGQITQVVRADGGNLIYLVVYTLVTTIVPYISYTTGLQQVENGVAAVLACIEPVMATVFGIFFFSEMPDLSGWLGILLVLIALTALNLQPKNEQSEDIL